MRMIDAHEDLAWNVLTFNRDYTRSAHATRAFEAETGSQAPTHNGDTLLGWPDFQKGEVAVVFATLFAAPARRSLGDWDKQAYRDFGQAHKIYQDQLDVYHRLRDRRPDYFTLVETKGDLAQVLSAWDAAPQPVLPVKEVPSESTAHDVENTHPVGLVVLMEGAEGVREPAELEMWWERGVRIIGPAWAGTRYCGGTNEPGPLTQDGYALLEVMASLGFTLDLSHMDEKAAFQALDFYPGALIASHANPAALLKDRPSNRFLSDQVIQGLVDRGGTIGVVPYNRFLRGEWTPAAGKAGASLVDVAAHIDYICQIAGDAHHVGIGSDFDGGFGLQSVPHEIDTIADLQKLSPLLLARGYSKTDVAAIFGSNWQNFLERTLPETV